MKKENEEWIKTKTAISIWKLMKLPKLIFRGEALRNDPAGLKFAEAFAK